MIEKSRIVATLLVLLSACGLSDEPSRLSAKQGSPRAGAGAQPRAGTAPNTSLVSPGPAPEMPSPEGLLLKGNRNSRETALGRLCWAEREASLAMAELLSTVTVVNGGPPPDEERGVKAVKRIKSFLSSLPAELGSDAGLPPEARPFRAHFIAAANQGRDVVSRLADRAPVHQRRETYESLDRLLDFENFAGAPEFARAAKSGPHCPDI